MVPRKTLPDDFCRFSEVVNKIDTFYGMQLRIRILFRPMSRIQLRWQVKGRFAVAKAKEGQRHLAEGTANYKRES